MLRKPIFQMLRNNLKSFIPVPNVSPIVYARRSAKDLAAFFKGEKYPLAPPNRFLFDGSENVEQYRQIGAEFLNYVQSLVGLSRSDSVLDIGCGIGRMAAAMTEYLGPDARYEGFDIVPLGIDWCRKNIQVRHQGFRFTHADIHNTAYNPRGRIAAEQYEFPYADDTFDLAISTSVFTHLLPDAMRHYLSEIARVLKPGGKALMTFFLMTPEARELIRAGKGILRFGHAMDGYWAEVARNPEAAVSYEESDVLAAAAKRGLALVPPIHYGSWCGRERFLSVQDIVVVQRKHHEEGV